MIFLRFSKKLGFWVFLVHPTVVSVLPFKRLFAPTCRSWMSKIFRDLESLGKSNGKKWSQIWKLLLIKGVKLLRKKKFVFGRILPYWAGFFCYRFFSLTPFNGLFAPTSWSPRSKLFRFSESLGKSNGKKWSQILKLLIIKGVKLPHKKNCYWANFALANGFKKKREIIHILWISVLPPPLIHIGQS